MTVSATHETSVRVRWSDADPAGIAFYSRFFEWYDLGTEALFAAQGMEWPTQEKTFRIEHEISVDGTPCARGFEIRAWVARAERPGGPLRARPIPETVARRLQEAG